MDMSSPPDFQWDDFDSTRGFRCQVTKRRGDKNYDVAECMMFLPVKADSYLKGEYRWSPDDRKKVE